MNRTDLERSIDRGLKALPEPRAPHTLLPSVMRAVRLAALRPWYARPWFTWPAGWQAASVAALLALVAGAAVSVPLLQPYAALAVSFSAGLTGPLAQVVAGVETLVSAVEIAGRVIGQSVIGLVLVLFAVMAATTVVVGAAIGRAALGGAYQS